MTLVLIKNLIFRTIPFKQCFNDLYGSYKNGKYRVLYGFFLSNESLSFVKEMLGGGIGLNIGNKLT